MAKVSQKPYMAGNWLIREEENYAYSRISVLVDNLTVANGLGVADIFLPGGYPMVGGVPASIAQVQAAAAITSMVFEPVVVPKGTRLLVCCIARGFNVVNADALPRGLYSNYGPGTIPPYSQPPPAPAGDWTQAQIVACAVLLGMIVRYEPIQQNEMTT